MVVEVAEDAVVEEEDAVTVEEDVVTGAVDGDEEGGGWTLEYATNTPEPGTMTLLAIGLAALGIVRRRRQR